ncbi:MAG: hypothetical protein KVP17_001313 [Porospora cf. gigantea B]|uniref:uncharacterized protein n=1 Tax=Porospora cf. gigantea B TaxID=2853592 RepID=UPI003571B186|nr:MAG: hypothetical protein KVP17_001313 [Porospora cf. gigantea B]
MDIDSFRAEVTQQGEKVRLLKKSKAEPAQVELAVKTLLGLKKQLAELEAAEEANKPLYVTCRDALENLLKRRFFVAPGFEIYGGAQGLFDFGPPGCAVKSNLEKAWREHFVLYEDLLELNCTCLTPHHVLKTSGHVERFCDLMVEDPQSGECYRADKVLEDHIDNLLRDKQKPVSPESKADLEKLYRQADALTPEEMKGAFDSLGIKSPSGACFSEPFPFNLMFKTTLGPKQLDNDANTGYLRPETAQGIFVNFRRLYEQNMGRMPFGGAQLGLGFRNEIAPRNGLLRVREFQMGEIEFFVDPLDKSHERFGQVKHLQLPLFDREAQLSHGKISRDLTLEEAVSRGVVSNESLAYFMGRTYLFLCAMGIQTEGLRYRQHLRSEMAHYACDCWDADILTSYGWVECVGHADRSAFDLTKHSETTGEKLVACREIVPPRKEMAVKAEIQRGKLGPRFKKDSQSVIKALESATVEQATAMEAALAATGAATIAVGDREFEVRREEVRFALSEILVHQETYTPHVIEPSFGIGRMFYAMMEHSFRTRGIEGQEERNYLQLRPRFAPYNCSLLSISNNKDFSDVTASLKAALLRAGVSCKCDTSSASIGKRYARTDEIGIPFSITVDFQSLWETTVTLRERDSMRQIRVPISEVPALVKDLSEERLFWTAASQRYPEFTEQEVRA